MQLLIAYNYKIHIKHYTQQLLKLLLISLYMHAMSDIMSYKLGLFVHIILLFFLSFMVFRMLVKFQFHLSVCLCIITLL